MGEKLEKYKKDNINNVSIGFLLELNFRQTHIINELQDLISFIESNSSFLKNINVVSVTTMINDFSSLFNSSINFIYFDVDSNENYCNYHSKFY